jgi:phosphoserine phosphatase
MTETLVLIRAGQTGYEREGRIRGTLEVPLCEEGLAQAQSRARAVQAWRPEALYAADDAAARETAAVIGRFGLSPRGLTGLVNLDHGLWQGLLVDEIRRRQPRLHRLRREDPWQVTPPRGEPFAVACERVETAVAKMLRRHPGGSVGLVVPEPLERIVRWLVAGENVGDLWREGDEASAVVGLPVRAQWDQPAQRRPAIPSVSR